MEVVQYIGGCSIHRGITSVLSGYLQYCGGRFSTVEVAQYSGGRFSNVGDSFSTVEVVQYSEGITSVHVGVTSVLWGITSILWRVFSTGGYSVLWKDTFNTVQGG